MSFWTIILCEGAHDQAVLTSVAQVCGHWKALKKTPASRPARLNNAFPHATKDSAEGRGYGQRPEYLFKRDSYVEVRALGSDVGVLGPTASDFLQSVEPDAFGIVVDADDKGVARRVQSFRNRYGPIYAHAKKVEPGCVVDGKPRIGLWVAPNNRNEGRMDDLLLKAASRTHKKLTTRGKRFASSMASVHLGKWTNSRNKAILGAINQVVAPGASLASALQRSKCWFGEDAMTIPEIRRLLEFIEALAGP